MKSGHSIERMELVDAVLLLQGWVVSEVTDVQPTELTLLGRSADGQYWRHTIPFNRERPDVCAALDIADTSLQCGFFFHGRIPEGEPLALLRHGKQGEVTLHTWAEQTTGGPGEYRQSLLSWSYLLRKAWGLLRSGQWRSLAERARRHLHAALASRKPRRMSEPQATPPVVDYLIIDHDMGGGANQYRVAKVGQLLHEGQCVVVLTFSVLGLRYVVRSAEPGGSLGPARHLTWAEVLPWIDQLQPRHIFYNNAVSFPHALALAEGLAAYKAEHRQTCQLTLTVHDYFALCPSQHLMSAEGRFCGLPSSMEVCNSCLKHSDQAMVSLYRHHGLTAWRQAWGTLLQAADQVLAFDPSARELLKRTFRPIADEHWCLRPHGVVPLTDEEQQRLARWRQTKTRKSGRIGVVGQIGSDYKGVKKVHELVNYIAQNKLPYEIVAIGQVSPKPANSLHYQETGPYKAHDLAKLVVENDIDVFFFSSEGPETYSYVLHELERFALPISAFNLGAQATFLSRYSQAIPLDIDATMLEIVSKLKPYLQD